MSEKQQYDIYISTLEKELASFEKLYCKLSANCSFFTEIIYLLNNDIQDRITKEKKQRRILLNKRGRK